MVYKYLCAPRQVKIFHVQISQVFLDFKDLFAVKLYNDSVIIFAESMTVINKGGVNGAANPLED